MGYFHKRLIPTLLFLIPVALLGQIPIHITGFVKDTLGTPLDFVSVYISLVQTSTVVTFTNTDEQGFYSLSIPSDTFTFSVTASMLGYKKESHLLNIREKNQGEMRLDFTLYPNPFSIEEVVVRDKLPPIISKSDTTEYQVSAFFDSTEYSVEDLLKKLPGVQVSEQGAISVNGKAIDKVLVEGDDVFGSNYTIVTRNVRASMIDKIQVIDHYQENPVMKEVSASESMVLNLSIHADKKRILSGAISLGGGWGEEWKGYLHTNLFSFSKKSKTILLSNWNNTGFNALGELEAMSGNLLSGGQSLKKDMLPNKSLLALPEVKDIGLPSKFTNRNRSGLFALNHIFNISDQFKVKASGIAMSDIYEQYYSNQTDFLLENQNLAIGEGVEFFKKGKSFEVELVTDYFPLNQKSSFRTFSSIQSANNINRLGITRKVFNQADFIPNDIEDVPKNYYSAAEYSTKIGKFSVGQIAFDYAKVNYLQVLNSISSSYPIFFEEDSTFVNLSQNSRWRQEVFHPFLRYIFNKKSYELNIEGGSSFSINKLTSGVALHDDTLGNGILTDIPFSNNRTIKKQNNYFRSSLKKQIKNVEITIGIDLKNLAIQVRDETERVSKESGLWLIVPAIRFLFAPNNDLRLNVAYRFNTDLPKEEMLFDGWYLLDYQTAHNGLIELSTIDKHHFVSSFRYRSLEKTFFLNSGFSAFLSDSEWGTAYGINTLLLSQNFFQPVKERFYIYHIQAEKYFPKLESRLLFRFNYSSFGKKNKVNTFPRNVLNNYYAFNLDYGSAFDGWFNIFITNEFKIANASIRQNNESNTFHSSQWKLRIKGVFKSNKHFFLDASLYRVDNYFKRLSTGDFYSMDMNATLRAGKKKWQGEITVNILNLFNNNSFKQFTISDYYQNHFYMEAVPRFFIIKWDTSF